MRRLIRIIVSVVIFAAATIALGRLVEPKYAKDLIEGSFTGEYYDETEDHQVLMIGDCELYENISPVELWRQYGITSYIRGNAQQLAWHSYYLLKEAIGMGKHPEAVIFSVLALKYNEPQKEEYNRLIIDTMRWSPEKVEMINAAKISPDMGNILKTGKKEGEHYVDYVVPLMRYHNRIYDLAQEDYEYYAKKHEPHTISGYYMRADVLPAENIPEENIIENNIPEDNSSDSAAEDTEGQEDTEEQQETKEQQEAKEQQEVKEQQEAKEDYWEEEEEFADIELEILESEDASEEEIAENIADNDTDNVSGNDAENDTDKKSDNIPDDKTGDNTGQNANNMVKDTVTGGTPLGDTAMMYLEKIRLLCEENDIPLILVKAPSLEPYWEPQWETQIEEYSEKNNLRYINMLENSVEIGIDYTKDTYDGGLHMNIYGAEKCADYLGRILKEELSLKDMHADKTVSEIWELKEKLYDEKKEEQLKQIEEYGKVVDP